MGLFGSKASSKTANLGATDQATVISGKKNTLVEGGAVSLGAGAKVVTGLDLSGSKTSGDLKVIGGADFGSNAGTITISTTNQNDPALLDLLGKVLDKQSATTTATSGTSGTSSLTLPGASAPIDGSTPTSGSPEASADIGTKEKWIAGLSIAAALLGIWFFFFRK